MIERLVSPEFPLPQDEQGFSRIGVIGDSATDIVGTDIAIHYAVGNATQELKNIASYVATSQFTSGVVEVLRQIKS